MKTFYAKSANPHHGKITNREHCEKVARVAEGYAEPFGRGKEAGTAGYFHDTGKNGLTFQGVLNGTYQRVDHAFPSAAFLCGMLGRKNWDKYVPVIEAVQGHHDGLVSLRAMEAAIRTTLKEPDADCCPSGKLPSLRGEEEFRLAGAAFRQDFPEYRFPKLPPRRYENQVENMLDTRMLFSCLVDADYSVSAADDDPDYFSKNDGRPLDADAALDALHAHRAVIRQESQSSRNLNLLRDDIFDACGQAGALPPGLYTLTAPTGAGKTLALLHFALRHCKTHAMRRIISVLPFLTLCEQTEKTYRKIFPEILVDHSQKEQPDELRELTERWDAPVVLTTSVRFFESLFSDRPSGCRKLHNIANSVILFDEAQSLPAALAPATVQAVRALCRKYGCTMVFSTATQPDFGALPGAEWHPTEILPGGRALFEKTRRVTFEWRLSRNEAAAAGTKWEDVAAEMAAYDSACAIVNLRRHARTLFQALSQRRGTTEGLYLLTTDLCPAHRLAVVDAIKARQAARLPCTVVATQCIEAGVDLDFGVMYRALAPLEAIAQAAGRCNRNGTCTSGRVIVFEPSCEGTPYPGSSYESAARIVKELWANDPALDPGDPEVIREYYRRCFKDSTPSKALEEALKDKHYEETARAYRLIQKKGIQLVVPWSGKQELFDEIRGTEQVSRDTLRRAAPITISSFDVDFVEQIASPLQIRCGGVPRSTGFYILNPGFEKYYNPVTGFQPPENTVENFMC